MVSLLKEGAASYVTQELHMKTPKEAIRKVLWLELPEAVK